MADLRCRHAAWHFQSTYLSSSETRVYLAIRRWKLHLPESTWCRESIGSICFTDKLRAASLRPLTFSNHRSNAVFSNASPGLMDRFGVFWKRESRPIESRQCRLLNRQLFFICVSIVYAFLCSDHWTEPTKFPKSPKMRGVDTTSCPW
jgi:hypothetical protein